MNLTSYHVTVSDSPRENTSPYQAIFSVKLRNGSWLNLPIIPLPGGEEGIALLMSNQTPFAVEDHVTGLLVELAREFQPEVIVGIPTLGLDYARLVARGLGFAQYVALGNSRKFWYDDDLSVPVHSVTSPGSTKSVYLDPALVERVRGKKTLIIDDVINTGGSAVAAIELLQRAGADLVGLGVVLVEGEAWKKELVRFSEDWPQRVRGLGTIPIFRKTPKGWIPIG
jgi:adenine/guanine phosphoribosyltransferase-like PRPP-binding protein